MNEQTAISLVLMVLGILLGGALIYMYSTDDALVKDSNFSLLAAFAGLLFAAGLALFFYVKFSASDADGKTSHKTVSADEAPEENLQVSEFENLSFEEELRRRKQNYYSGAKGTVVERHEASRTPVNASIPKRELPAKPDSGKVKIVLPFGKKKGDPLRDLLDAEEKTVKEAKPWRSS